MSEFFEYKFLAMEYFYKYVCEEELLISKQQQGAL